MTIATTIAANEYVGNGSIAQFEFTFVAYDSNHVKVDIDGSTLSSGFTVSRNSNNVGGTVTLDSAPASGVEVIVRRDLPVTQELDLVRYGRFPAENIERALDEGVMIDQQLDYHAKNRVLNLSGGANTMEQDLDMDGFKVIHSGPAVNGTDLVTLEQAKEVASVAKGAQFVQEEQPTAGMVQGSEWYIPSKCETYVYFIQPDGNAYWVNEDSVGDDLAYEAIGNGEGGNLRTDLEEVNTYIDSRRFDSVESAKSYANLSALIGSSIKTKEYYTGTGFGGGEWLVGTNQTANGYDIIQSDYDNSIYLSLIKDVDGIDPRQVGWVNDQSQADKDRLKYIVANFKIKPISRNYTLADIWAGWRYGENFSVVMVGDSTTEGSHVSTHSGPNVLGTNYTNTNSYSSLITAFAGEMLGQAISGNVHNAGFGGKTMVRAYDNSNAMVYDNANYNDAKIAIISHAINDTVLESIDDFKASTEALIIEMYDKGIQPILMTSDPVFINNNVLGWDFSDLWQRYEKAKESIAEKYGIEYIDTRDELYRFANNNTQKLNFGIIEPDALHMMDTGHSYKAGLLLSKIAPVFVIDGKVNEFSIGYQDYRQKNTGFYHNNANPLGNMANAQLNYNENISTGRGEARYLAVDNLVSRGLGNTFVSSLVDTSGSEFAEVYFFNPFDDYALYLEYRDQEENTSGSLGKIKIKGYLGHNDDEIEKDLVAEITTRFYQEEVCRQFVRKLPTGFSKVSISGASVSGEFSFIEGMLLKRATADLNKTYNNNGLNIVHKKSSGLPSMPYLGSKAIAAQPDTVNMSNHYSVTEPLDEVIIKCKVNFPTDENYIVLGYNLRNIKATSTSSEIKYQTDNILNGFGVYLSKTAGNRLGSFTRLEGGNFSYAWFDSGFSGVIADQENIDLYFVLKYETDGTTTVEMYNGLSNYNDGVINNTWSVGRYLPSSYTGALHNYGPTTSGGEIISLDIIQKYVTDRQL